MESGVLVTDLERRYQQGDAEVRALDGITATVPKGRVTAITGESGSGKSTLLNLIAGMDTPTAGSIEAFGRALHKLDRRALTDYRRQSVGCVFQAFHLLVDRTALENVELPLMLAGVRPQLRRQEAEAALIAVGLSDRLHHAPGQLSGGEQQRVAIARAVIGDPELLVADEPTGNLDSRTSGAVIELLVELTATRGLTTVIVTHDRDAVVPMSDLTYHLHDGRISGGQHA